jgi:hypothetical protein
MPAVNSTLRYDSVYLAGMEKVWAPPIPFEWDAKSAKKEKASNGEDSDLYREFDVPIKQGNEDSDSYSRKLKVFNDGSAEQYCAFIEDYQDFLQEAGYQKDFEAQYKVL